MSNAFDKSKNIYQTALNKSGYNHQLTYLPAHLPPTQNPNKNRKRKRNITWYNPPFDSSVATNLGHEFLKLIKSSFHQAHPLSKIFNKNSIKLSYSCMPNIKSIINGHNTTLANTNNTPEQVRTCNCRAPQSCPLEGKCLSTNIIYQAKVTSNGRVETYVGLTENTFKTRFNNHNSSFNNTSKRNNTELSKYIWSLKDNNTNFNVTWKILEKAKAYSPANKQCHLCNSEKFYILYKPELSSLNKRHELVSKCRHSNKYILKNLKC